MILSKTTSILVLIFIAYNPNGATDPSETNVNFPPRNPFTTPIPIPTKSTSRYILFHVLPSHPRWKNYTCACQPANCHPSCSSSRTPM
ncbi:hypothetical protein QBC34DRAFT_401448 [Podospora aff. communis PSN243]|uniref:Uncharacterized protein n=1 Tax=Podospora aff. communis PSN243 TaxID=3040156 RepID=A0AAV9GU60_9PEZI|nr:hypothetical protein QBC34DRAFT_401448 [Podospora aff. communis PSN243]